MRSKSKVAIYEKWNCSCCNTEGTHRLDPGATRWECIACGRKCTPYLGEV